MFDQKSRYASLVPYPVRDHRGRIVLAVPVAPAPNQMLLGTHKRVGDQRLDYLANLYLSNQTGFWRIAEENDVTLAETLTETQNILIPRP
ncbi:MAG TPA: hypothetical protein VMT95_12715 [Candidatus Binatia bacterium]|nr:hypothetical protein [Candidatus Binatia bacterium]